LSRFAGVEASDLLDLVPEAEAPSFFSDFALLGPPLVVEASLSDFCPLAAVPDAVGVVGREVFVADLGPRNFISSPDDFWFARFEGGSSPVDVVAAFLFFFEVPGSVFGVVGRLLAFGVEEATPASAFSALRVTELDVDAAEATVRCRILADDCGFVSVVDSGAGLVAALVVGLEGGFGIASSDASAFCCSGIDCSFAADITACDINGGGNGVGGFVRETLPQLVENHLASAGTRRVLLVCVAPPPEADAVPISFMSTKASHPL